MSYAFTDEDIARLVPRFYARVRADVILGPIFNGAIDDWAHHLGKLEAFWSSVMLTSGRYKGQPMVAHLRHAEHMTEANFRRWLTLWEEVTEDVLGPEAAKAFQDKAAASLKACSSVCSSTASARRRYEQRDTRGASFVQTNA